jgi:hypothetical protein
MFHICCNNRPVSHRCGGPEGLPPKSEDGEVNSPLQNLLLPVRGVCWGSVVAGFAPTGLGGKAGPSLRFGMTAQWGEPRRADPSATDAEA